MGVLIALAGAITTLGGCLLGATLPRGGIIFYLGMAMVVLGWMISNAATKKTCPQCAELVKYKAMKCKHCGYEFGPLPRSQSAARVSLRTPPVKENLHTKDW